MVSSSNIVEAFKALHICGRIVGVAPYSVHTTKRRVFIKKKFVCSWIKFMITFAMLYFLRIAQHHIHEKNGKGFVILNILEYILHVTSIISCSLYIAISCLQISKIKFCLQGLLAIESDLNNLNIHLPRKRYEFVCVVSVCMWISKIIIFLICTLATDIFSWNEMYIFIQKLLVVWIGSIIHIHYITPLIIMGNILEILEKNLTYWIKKGRMREIKKINKIRNRLIGVIKIFHKAHEQKILLRLATIYIALNNVVFFVAKGPIKETLPLLGIRLYHFVFDVAEVLALTGVATSLADQVGINDGLL